MNYAYTDSSNNLVAYCTSGSDLSLVFVQGIIPTAVTKIDNVPAGLTVYQPDEGVLPDETTDTYHQHTTGDGTDVSHWTLQEDLRPIKEHRKSLVDGKTGSLILAGFVFEGIAFSASSYAQLNLESLKNNVALNILNDATDFPRGWSTKKGGEYTIADGAKALGLYDAGLTHISDKYDSGRALRLSIDAATTEAAIALVVDNR